MAEAESAAEVARALADALQRQRLPYAIGGAIALGYDAAPRATVDVDINVFVAPESHLDRVLAAVAGAGFAAHERRKAEGDRTSSRGPASRSSALHRESS